MSETARVALADIIKRLADHAAGAAGSYWVGDRQAEAAAEAGFAAGRLHFARAVRSARRALATDDPAVIADAAPWCLMLEREGLRLAQQHEKAMARRRGGRTSGQRRTERAQKLYEPFVRLYWEKRDKGKTPGTALALAKNILKANGAVLPTDRTLRTWIKKRADRQKMWKAT
jgi:hypothetical protein